MRTLTERVMDNARSEGNACIRCGACGTTCGRHYNGLRQHTYGKGRGIKCHPFLVADFCDMCDRKFQEGSVDKMNYEGRVEYSEEFQHWCLLSLIRRVENEVIH